MINDFYIQPLLGRQHNHNISIYKYVDDLTMVECRKLTEPSQIQGVVDNLSVWANGSKMKLNPVKCFNMNICFSRGPINHSSVVLENGILATVNEVKLLGVTIQNDLKWESHIKDLEKRASAKLYMLRCLVKYGLSQTDLLTVFVGYIRSLLEYAAPVWSGGLTQNQKDRLERIQKRALRIILRREYSDYDSALVISHLKTLESRRNDLCLKFFQKTLTFTDQFKQYLPQRQHNRSLRNLRKIPDFRCRTVRMQNSPIPFLIRLFNE